MPHIEILNNYPTSVPVPVLDYMAESVRMDAIRRIYGPVIGLMFWQLRSQMKEALRVQLAE